MKDEYMKKYCDEMDKIGLPEEADRKILSDLLRRHAEDKGETVKALKGNRRIAVAAVILVVISITAAACAAIYEIIIRSSQKDIRLGGVEAITVDIEGASYFALSADDAGAIYTITDSYEVLSEYNVIVWKSMDQGDTWEAVLQLPEEVERDCFLVAGDLREDEAGMEAGVMIAEENEDQKSGYMYRVYRVTEGSCTEYRMNEVYALAGDQSHLFQMKFVNDHIIAFLATEMCIFYDTDTQEVLRQLPYNMTMGCLSACGQFFLYGADIYSCLDAETLEEETPAEELQEFVRLMYEENDGEVFPPMQAQGDTIVCAAKHGIYEYRNGKTEQIRQLGVSGYAVNGLRPICKGRNGEYYICVSTDAGVSLLLIDGEKAEMK